MKLLALYLFPLSVPDIDNDKQRMEVAKMKKTRHAFGIVWNGLWSLKFMVA